MHRRISYPRPVRRPLAVILVALALAAFQFLLSGNALADVSCTNDHWYRPGQFSTGSDFSGVWGNITAPVATTLQGDTSNNYHYEHILNWLEMLNENPPGGCGAGEAQCWIQAGIGMGSVGWSQGGCNTSAYNGQDISEDYYEVIGAGGGSDCHDYFYPNIAICQGCSITTWIYYDGSVGYTGKPQFDAYVDDKNHNPVELRTDELYYSADHAAAVAEVYSGTSSACPTLTDGAPYQNFGTDHTGQYSSNTALQLESGNNWSEWGGSPDWGSDSPYWYTALHPFSAFQPTGRPAVRSEQPGFLKRSEARMRESAQ